MAEKEKTHRIHITYSEPFKERMDHILEKSQCVSASEFFRKSAALYAMVLEEEEKGSDILIRTKDGEIERIRLIL